MEREKERERERGRRKERRVDRNREERDFRFLGIIFLPPLNVEPKALIKSYSRGGETRSKGEAQTLIIRSCSNAVGASG